MKIANLPDNEGERIIALERYGIMDTPSDAVFDCITQAAANACGTPVALISLLDANRQWFKSCIGLDVSETPRDVAFCSHAINNPAQLLEIEDATKDDRFHDNPLVTGDPKIRFYAGKPLVTPDGFPLGSLCVIDFEPRKLNDFQRSTIDNLANAIIGLFEERRHSPIATISNAIEETLRTGLIITDPNVEDNPIIYCNRGFEKITGYSKSEVIGQNCRFLQGPDTDQTTVKEIRAALANEHDCLVTLKNYRKDGSEFWNEFSLSPIRSTKGKLTHYLGITTDITQRQNAEESVKESHELLEQRVADRTAELQESEERFRNLFENAHELIQSVTPEGKFMYVNPAWIKSLGYEESDLESITILDIIHPDSHEHCMELFQTVLTEGFADEIEADFVSKSGNVIHVEGSASCQFKNGQPVSTRAIFHDITAREVAAQSLQEAKEVAERATEMKSKFLAAASHDLRQPLHAIGLYVSTLGQMTKGPKEQLICGKVRETLDSVREVLDALLDISKLETGNVTPNVTEFSVQEFFNQLAVDNEPIANTKGLEFFCKTTDCFVKSDRALLRRILENLIGNAIRYTQRGCVIVECLRVEDHVKIQVKDTGSGIPKDELDSIFEDFVQLDNPSRTHKEGVGMGLSIVKHIAKLLGHRLNVESSIDVGSTFSIEIPLGQDCNSEPIQNDSSSNAAPDRPGPSVLFVDDDERIIDATQLRMSASGFQVQVAISAETAISLVDGGLRPDVIVTDFHLPKVNGLELIDLIRVKTGDNLPAVLVTGDMILKKKESEFENCTVLNKPMDVEQLVSTIKSVDARSN